jgi:hypothetical protein
MGQLAELLAMDRATLGHNLHPLERDGLPEIRARVATITTAGLHRIKRGRPSGITRTAPLSALSAPRKRPRCAGFSHHSPARPTTQHGSGSAKTRREWKPEVNH